FLTARLMKRVDGRLILALGFATVAVACWMNAQLTSAWAGGDFLASQLVIALGLSFTLVGVVGMVAPHGLNRGAMSRPFDVLTYSSFIHMVRLFGGELGTAVMQRLVAVREQFHSNMTGLHVGAGDWLTEERLKMLTGGITPGSSGQEEAQGRAL